MKWRGTDTYLLWAGPRRLTAGLTRPSSSPAVFPWPPPSLSEALTHKPRKIYSTLAPPSARWLPNKVKQLKVIFHFRGTFILSVITQVCPGTDGSRVQDSLAILKNSSYKQKNLLLCGSAAAFTRGQKVLLLLLFLGGAGWRRYDEEIESKTAFLQLATTLEPPLSRVTSAQTAVLLSVYSFSVYSVCKHTANDRLAPLTSVTCNYMCLHLSQASTPLKSVDCAVTEGWTV